MANAILLECGNYLFVIENKRFVGFLLMLAGSLEYEIAEKV